MIEELILSENIQIIKNAERNKISGDFDIFNE